MTQKEQMVQWFKAHDGFATLGEILKSGEPWSYEFRARATDLRKEGYRITCDRGDHPSRNLYRLRPPIFEGLTKAV